jgi:hypothetical protein
MSNTLIKYFFAVSCFAFIAFSNWNCGISSQQTPEQIALARTEYAGLSDTARYVGMNTCKGCHTEVHASFIHTGMGKSFDTASQNKTSADFSNPTVVHDEHLNMHYHPYWQDGKLFFNEFRGNTKDTAYSRTEQVKYIVGSGQHTNSHMWESNGYLFQAPMTFYTQKGKWDLPPGFENGANSRFNRIIGLECMTCHNGYPEFVAGSENKFTKVQNGIDCERCHGPGSIHVQEKSMGILIDTAKRIDYSIVNPSKLPIDLQFDVCQRCHVQGNTVLNEGKSFFDFKPGMRLSDVMYVFMPVYKGKENEHIMASHVERLKMSKCFITTTRRLQAEGNGKTTGLKPFKNGLTCITCHNPHISVKETGNDHFNSTCKSCHAVGKEHLCSKNSNVAMKGGKDDCVSCHMPVQGTLDIPHVSVHDHRIAVHQEVKEVEKMKTFIGINCLNDSNPPDKIIAQAYINYVEKFGMEKTLLDSAMVYLKNDTKSGIEENIHQYVQLYYLKNDFAGIVSITETIPKLLSSLNRKSYDNKDAWTSYRIGEAMQNTGRTQSSVQWFKNAYILAPLYPDFGNKYANALAGQKNFAEARKIFSSLVKEHPYYAPAFSNLGYLILIQEGNVNRANSYLDKALALDPDYELAILNKAAAFMSEGKVQDARKYLQKVLQINPENRQAIEGLKRITK